MDVIRYRHYIVHNWQRVLTRDVQKIFRLMDKGAGIWIRNGQVIAGYEHNNIFRPIFSHSRALLKQKCQTEFMRQLNLIRYQKYRIAAALILVNKGIDMYIAERIALFLRVQ